MRKIKTFIRKAIFKYIIPDITNNSNSQAGEDRIVNYLFSSMGINNITYIDIGANDPVRDNNTYFFYLKQNNGVLIEPDSNFYSLIKKTRHRDIVINAAISHKETDETDFFIFNLPSLNTLSKKEADLRVRSVIYKLIETRKIKLLTIENIISEYLNNKTPDLISLDIEGVDYKVLNSFDFEKYPVPVWIVETCKYSESHIKPKAISTIDLMLSKGYFVFADTYINTIFVNKTWYENYSPSN
jgi:FkbM family methyltransferase